MILCPDCGHSYASDRDGCGQCDFKPAVLDGFVAWATELANSNDGYDNSAYKSLADHEATNFWFINRNRIVTWAMSKYCSLQQGKFLEVGCGTGFVLAGISRSFPAMDVSGSEIHVDGLKFAAKRVPSATFQQLDARRIPYIDEFDVIGAFDVIEHIGEDGEVLKSLESALKPGGYIILTVPQHPWLWSQADEIAHHKRRYTREALHGKLNEAGLRIEFSTSFMTLLLPVMALSRLLPRQKSSRDSPNHEVSPPALLNLIFDGMLRMELMLIKWGAGMPFGGSRLVVAKRTRLAES